MKVYLMIAVLVSILPFQVSAVERLPTDIRFRLEKDYKGKDVCSYVWASNTEEGYSYQYVECSSIPRGVNWCSDEKYRYKPEWCKLISDACLLVCPSP